MVKEYDHKSKYVLVLNAGSATLKWALFWENSLGEIGRGVVERIGGRGSFSEWRLEGKAEVKHTVFANHKFALIHVLKILAWHHFTLSNIKIIGHRVVHGGPKFKVPVGLTSKIFKDLTKYSALAPLHNPIQIQVAKLSKNLLPKAKQIAVFDTAWFGNLSEYVSQYPVPRALATKYQLQRFGFHGISHSYVAQVAARSLGKKLDTINLITCHLGSGSSITAVRAGRAIDTSMGFTPLEGLMMCTRAGDIDAGLVLHLLKQKGISQDKLQQMLQKESGLKGVAGVSDMREVLVRAGYEVLGFKSTSKINEQEKKQARLALRMFIYRVQKYIGAYAAILGQVDAIVFTGGIGERNEIVRNLIMKGLPILKNVSVLVIPTNEELAIAKQITSKQ